MVYCRECKQRVEDCPHFVGPLAAKPIDVFDPKVKTLAYEEKQRVLEIRFKNGQAWQLFGVPPDIYQELLKQTMSSFLKFIAHRYNPAPVRQTEKSLAIPGTELCQDCKTAMALRHKTGGNGSFARVLWHCTRCNKSAWHTYGSPPGRDRKNRWH